MKKAAAAWDRILEMAQRPGYRAHVSNSAAYAYSLAGDEATAIQRWQMAIAEAQKVYQAGDSVDVYSRAAAIEIAYDALVELVNRNVDFDLYDRGIIDLAAEAYAPAIFAFQEFIKCV